MQDLSRLSDKVLWSIIASAQQRSALFPGVQVAPIVPEAEALIYVENIKHSAGAVCKLPS